MVIEVTYNVTDVYMSTTVSPIYITVDYSGSGGSGASVWGSITGTLSNQTDLQTALDGKFDDPTGTTSQYLRGDGSLATFPSLTGYVPYSGATSAVDLGEYGISAGQVTLDVSPTGTAAVGTTQWNDTIGSSQTTLKGGSVVLKNGVDLVARVVNKVSPNTTLTKAAYQAVRVSGAQGQRLAVAFAQANNDNNSADTIGLVIETIATNQEGFIITVGQIEGINTTGSLQGETWADGDVLYLSPTVAGALTNVKPTGATGHIVIIGYVEYAHANNGKIYVKVMNGWELDELHNVYISSVANNQGLFYESSTSLWKNKSISTVLGYTPEQPLTFSLPLARSTNTVSINAASSSSNGYLSSTDWSTFNGKQNALTNPVTGTGTSNELAYFSGTSAISSLTTATYPSLTELSYVKGVTSSIQTQLNAKGSGTVTSVAALTLGTTGIDVSSTVANGTTTPVITLNIPTASATNRGALSSTDWSTFNSKQGALTLTTTGTSGAATLVGNTLNIPQYSGGGGMAIGGSITSATAGSVLFAGTSGVLSQDNSNLFWDNTNKRLGIGTATPSYTFHISGANAGIFLTRTSPDESFIVLSNTALTSGAQIRGLATAVGMRFTNQNGTTEWARFHSTGNFTINSNSDAGYKFDVSGTARIQDNLLISKNQNTTTSLVISNTNSHADINIITQYISDVGSGTSSIGKNSTLKTAYKSISAKDAYFYNGTTGGDITIHNDFASGNIKFAAGGSSSAHMTIKSNGRINMSSLPTSSTGLSTGDLWNDAGTLKIV